MANRSKVAQQKASVREELERRLRGLDGRVPTIDELMGWLHGLGLDFASDPVHGISRSGVARWAKNWRKLAAELQQSEQVAGSIIGSLSESTGGNTRRMLTQMLTMLALHTVKEAGASKEATEPRDVMFLAKAIRDIEGAFKTGAESEFEIKKQLSAKVEKKVEEARASGVDPAILQRAKELVRGAIDA